MKRYSVLMGIGAGVMMAIAVLFFLIQNQYAFLNFGFFMVVVIGVVLPTVLHPLQAKGFSMPITKRVMILVSFLIGLGYSYYVTKSITYESNLFTQLVAEVCIIHGAALLVTWMPNQLEGKKNGD